MSRLGGPGLAAALAANVLWGCFPLYWPLVEPVGALEVLGHRTVWSVLFVLALLALSGGFAWMARLSRRTVGLLGVAAVLSALQWIVFIHGIDSGHIVEVSLGYFMSPLFTVALAVLVLRERLRPMQWAAVMLVSAAVLALTADYGEPPWIALAVALSFAMYSMVKKDVGLDGKRSYLVESSLLAVPALPYLLWLGASGDSSFTSEGTVHALMLMSVGIVASTPLILFGVAAVRLRLATLGILMYLSPTLQFLTGVLVEKEDMPLSRLAGFGLVWIALAVFTTDALRNARRVPAAVALREAPEPAALATSTPRP